MESIPVRLDKDLFDKAVHGGLDINPVMPEVGDLSVYAKPNATQGCNGMVCITFTVRLPDGTIARAQAVTTAKLFILAGKIVQMWDDVGLLGRAKQN
jgi:hypothetical protein